MDVRSPVPSDPPLHGPVADMHDPCRVRNRKTALRNDADCTHPVNQDVACIVEALRELAFLACGPASGTAIFAYFGGRGDIFYERHSGRPKMTRTVHGDLARFGACQGGVGQPPVIGKRQEPLLADRRPDCVACAQSSGIAHIWYETSPAATGHPPTVIGPHAVYRFLYPRPRAPAWA